MSKSSQPAMTISVIDLKGLGVRIRHARKKLGWKQKDLALACGWKIYNNNSPLISQYERGTRSPDIDRICLISEKLGVCPRWLAFGDYEFYAMEYLYKQLDNEDKDFVKKQPSIV